MGLIVAVVGILSEDDNPNFVQWTVSRPGIRVSVSIKLHFHRNLSPGEGLGIYQL